MKNFFAIFLFILSVCGLTFASEPQYVSKSQIILTDLGIVVNVDGALTSVDSIAYIGNGIYQCEQPYYGSCGRCGWPRNEAGQCTNQNCNGYGPSKD